MTHKPLAIIDVETTGCNPLLDRVIEIAVIRTDGAGEFSSLVNPERSLPPFITSLTGISAGDLAGAPLFEEIASEIAVLLEGAVFTAHNARFDYGFVHNEFKRKLYPKQKQHNLESIIVRHGIPVEQRHRALDDARAVEAYLALSREEVGAATFMAAMTKVLNNPSLPVTGVTTENGF